MKEAAFALAFTWVLVAVLLTAEPWFTRRNVLFGVVFGNDGIWKDRRAAALRKRYLLTMAAGAVPLSLSALAGCLWSQSARPGSAALLIPYFAGLGALCVFGTVVFVVFHGKTLALKAARGPDKELTDGRVSVETSLPDRRALLPLGGLFLLLPALLASYAVAVLGYPAMPERFPTHYGLTSANAWAPKSWTIVALPLLIDTAVTIILLACCLFTRRAPASVRGNPEAAPKAFRYRKWMLATLIAFGLLMQLSFLLVEVGFLTPIPPLLFEVPTFLSLALLAAVVVLYVRFVRVKKPRGPVLNDDARWVFGIFYYNRSDPSVFVEKRTGIGYTCNFARPASWAFLLGILLFIVLLFFIR